MLLLWVYCCTPIAVLAVYLSRWRQNATLPSIIVYWRSLHFIPYVTMIGHWARKFNDQSTRNLFKKFATNDPLAKSNDCEFLPWKLLHKNPVLSEKTWLYLSKRSAYLGILVIHGQSVDIVGSFLAVMKLFACGILCTWGSRGGSPSLMAIKEPAETGILRWIFVNDRKTGLWAICASGGLSPAHFCFVFVFVFSPFFSGTRKSLPFLCNLMALPVR